MLGKLVNKFKKHSLQEETPTNTTASSNPPAYSYRRSARISALYGDNNALHDSGTESDDDELEQLESIVKRGGTTHGGNDIMGSSPPNLTSSPPLISEFDTNSWDSAGCESGIVMRDKSDDLSDLPQDFSLVNDTVKSSSVAVPLFDAGNKNGGVVAAGGRSCTENSGKHDTGAFRPVTRRRNCNENQDGLSAGVGANLTSSTAFSTHQGTIGEKRRYENITPKLCFDNSTADPPSSPIASRLRSFNNSNPTGDGARETLVAARRQPVKLIIHNPTGVRRMSQASLAGAARNAANEVETSPMHPLKRGRMNSSGRPSLDFEKMRERLFVSSVCGIGSQEFVDSAMGDSDKDIEKRKHDWALSSSTSSGRRCPMHQQVRCQQTDCTFRPVEQDGLPLGPQGDF